MATYNGQVTGGGLMLLIPSHLPSPKKSWLFTFYEEPALSLYFTSLPVVCALLRSMPAPHSASMWQAAVWLL